MAGSTVLVFVKLAYHHWLICCLGNNIFTFLQESPDALQTSESLVSVIPFDLLVVSNNVFPDQTNENKIKKKNQ